MSYGIVLLLSLLLSSWVTRVNCCMSSFLCHHNLNHAVLLCQLCLFLPPSFFSLFIVAYCSALSSLTLPLPIMVYCCIGNCSCSLALLRFLYISFNIIWLLFCVLLISPWWSGQVAGSSANSKRQEGLLGETRHGFVERQRREKTERERERIFGLLERKITTFWRTILDGKYIIWPLLGL